MKSPVFVCFGNRVLIVATVYGAFSSVILSFFYDSEKQNMYSSHIPIGNAILFCLQCALDCRHPQSSAPPNCPLELALFLFRKRSHMNYKYRCRSRARLNFCRVANFAKRGLGNTFLAYPGNAKI